MERRIILIGKTGHGKSSTGNTLLGTSAFPTGISLFAVTQICQLRSSYNATNNLRYTIVDTPGLMDNGVPLGERLLELQRSIEICPEPHAFLLIFSSVGRMTRDEKYTVDLLRITFGERLFEHCIIVFTHGNAFCSDQEFASFCKQSPMIVKFVERCGGRIKRIENTGQVQHKNAINNLIETMSDRGNKTYKYSYINQHREVLKEHVQRYVGTGNLEQELSALAHAIDRALDHSAWTFGATMMNGIAAAAGAVWSLASRARFW